jgi:hypothetical protein
MKKKDRETRYIKELEKIEGKTKFKHFQHTKSFNKELSTPNQNITTPFRLLDSIWLFGKYKGQKLDTIPVSYLSWVMENFSNLSSTHKVIIQQEISNKTTQ